MMSNMAQDKIYQAAESKLRRFFCVRHFFNCGLRG